MNSLGPFRHLNAIELSRVKIIAKIIGIVSAMTPIYEK
jgi:hypothetical protein